MSEFLAERVDADAEIEQWIFGTGDPEAIWQEVLRLCPEAVDCFAYQASASVLFGLVLRGGVRAALKVHGQGTSADVLDAQQQIQMYLWRYGFPCPRPLGVRGSAALEEWRDDGVHRDAHEPEVRRVLAQHLVRLTNLTRRVHVPVDLPPFLPRPGGPLWPLQALEATPVAWIDEIARDAKTRRDAGGGDIVIAHHDWRAKNIRFEELRPAVIYAWDNLSVDAELVFVGSAAASFTEVASVDESFLFLAEYERARNSGFTREEQSTAAAAAVYARAYATRCVHAIGGDVDELGLPEYAAALLQ